MEPERNAENRKLKKANKLRDFNESEMNIEQKTSREWIRFEMAPKMN